MSIAERCRLMGIARSTFYETPADSVDVRFVGFGRGRSGSDFNDLLLAAGAQAVRAGLKAAVEVTRAQCERRIDRWRGAQKARQQQHLTLP